METDSTQSIPAGFKRRAFRNSAWLTLDRLIRGGLNLVVLICIGRFLGPERFGGLQLCPGLRGDLHCICLCGT